MEHAQCIAKRIANGHQCQVVNVHVDDNNNDVNNSNNVTEDSTIPKVVYADPFMRTTHTGHIIAKELGNTIKLRSEDGVWEWLIPSLLVDKSTGKMTEPNSIKVLKNKMKFDSLDMNYKSIHSYKDKMIVTFPESEEQLLNRCEITVSKLIQNTTTETETEDRKANTDTNNNNNYDSICIVSHAPCLQAMAYYLDIDSTSPKESKIVKPWPLGGITMFSRRIITTTTTTTTSIIAEEHGYVDGEAVEEKDVECSKWKCEFYGCTNHMIGDYKNGIKEWSLPCFDTTTPSS